MEIKRKVKRFGNGAHIILPKYLIDEIVDVTFKKREVKKNGK